MFEGVENVDWEKRKNSEKIMVYDENYLRDIIAFIKEYSAHFGKILTRFKNINKFSSENTNEYQLITLFFIYFSRISVVV